MVENKNQKRNNFKVYFLCLLLSFSICSNLKEQKTSGELEQKYNLLKQEKNDLVTLSYQKVYFLQKENEHLKKQLYIQKKGSYKVSLSFPINLIKR